MLKLLKTEWYILSKSSIFWIMISLCVVCMIALPFIIYTFKIDDISSRLAMFETAFSFPIVFNTIGVIELLSAQLLCFYFIVIICNEFEFGTFRMHIQAGTSKIELWKSKLALSIILCIFSTLVVFILSFVFGFINDDEFDVIINTNSIKTILLFSFQLFAYFNFATTLALIIKKTGPVIIIYFLWFGLFERTFAQFINGRFDLYPLGALLPGKSIEELTYLEAFKGYFIRVESYQILKTFFAVFWTSLSIFTNYILFKKVKY